MRNFPTFLGIPAYLRPTGPFGRLRAAWAAFWFVLTAEDLHPRLALTKGPKEPHNCLESRCFQESMKGCTVYGDTERDAQFLHDLLGPERMKGLLHAG